MSSPMSMSSDARGRARRGAPRRPTRPRVERRRRAPATDARAREGLRAAERGDTDRRGRRRAGRRRGGRARTTGKTERQPSRRRRRRGNRGNRADGDSRRERAARPGPRRRSPAARPRRARRRPRRAASVRRPRGVVRVRADVTPRDGARRVEERGVDGAVVLGRRADRDRRTPGQAAAVSAARGGGRARGRGRRRRREAGGDGRARERERRREARDRGGVPVPGGGAVVGVGVGVGVGAAARGVRESLAAVAEKLSSRVLLRAGAGAAPPRSMDVPRAGDAAGDGRRGRGVLRQPGGRRRRRRRRARARAELHRGIALVRRSAACVASEMARGFEIEVPDEWGPFASLAYVVSVAARTRADGEATAAAAATAAVRLLPIRPRSRGARRSLRTFPVVTLHPRFPFNV